MWCVWVWCSVLSDCGVVYCDCGVCGCGVLSDCGVVYCDCGVVY